MELSDELNLFIHVFIIQIEVVETPIIIPEVSF